MKAQNTHGWSTLQEGTEHFLYRSVSSMSFAKVEALVQRLQSCQNPSIAVPEIVRLANGEIYLKEPRGIKSIEDFLSTNPSPRAKLFVVQQLLKLVENLHTFVGTAHGNIHLGCLSIGIDDKLVLGGIAPVNASIDSDITELQDVFASMFTTESEKDILTNLSGNSLKKLRRSLKVLLAEDAWDDIQSDWNSALQQTNLEESSEELLTLQESQQTTGDDEDSFDFTDDDGTLELDDPFGESDHDNLDGMPEPRFVHSENNEIQTLDALFDEFDDLDDLDDFADEETALLEIPVPTSSVTISEANVRDTSEDWSDVDLEDWLDEVPNAQHVPASADHTGSLEGESSERSDASFSTNDTITPEMFSNALEDDWFSQTEDTMPLIRHETGLDDDGLFANLQQESADLDELSDFDDDDDDVQMFVRPTVESTNSPTASSSVVAAKEAPQNDDDDWFDYTETADFMLSDLDMDSLTPERQQDASLATEAAAQSIDDLDEFAEELDIDDIAVNETDIKAAEIDVDHIPALDDESDFSTDIFSRSSLLGTLDVHIDDLDRTNDVKNQPKNVELSTTDDDDWFASTQKPPTAANNPPAEDTSIPKWMLVAGAAVVAGGAWAATQTRQVDTPSVLVDETQTKGSASQNETPQNLAQNKKDAGQVDNVEDKVTVKTEVPIEDTFATSKTVEAETTAKKPEAASTIKKTSALKQVKPTTTKRTSSVKSKTPAVNTSKAKSSTPFAKAKTTAPKTTTKTSVATLPAPKKSETKPKVSTVEKPAVQAPTKSSAPVAAAVKEDIKAKPPVVESSKEMPKKPVSSDNKAESIAASLSGMVTGTSTQKEVEQKPAPIQNVVEEAAASAEPAPINETPNQVDTPEVEAIASVQRQEAQQQPPTEPSAESAVDPVTNADVAEDFNDDNEVVDIADTIPDAVVTEVNTAERVMEEEVVPSIAKSALNELSQASISGKLTQTELETLQKVAKSDVMYTRANAIVLTHAQQLNDSTLIEDSLNKLLSVEANTHKPIFLLAMAQHQFNQQNLDGAREYLMQAEMNWAHVERTQLSVLRAQRDNIVAHLSYIDFLETGSEDSRLQSLTQFRKVQREARRARLQSLFEQAESKMQKLQRNAQ